MTLAFRNFKKDRNRLLQQFIKLRPETAEKDFEQLFGFYEKSWPFKAAARMVRFHSKQYASFLNLLVNSLRDCEMNLPIYDHLRGWPLMVLAKDPDKIRVFPNIILNEVLEDAMVTTSCYVTNVLETFEESLRKDLNGPITSKKWIPTKRAWTRIKKYEEMSVATVLSRYTGLGTKLNAAQIRDVAAGIEEMRKPMQLIFCKDPADMIDMYDSKGPESCMRNRHARDKGWDKIIFPHGIHPCSFFYFHPYIKGVYSKHKGAVCARTFLYHDENNKKFFGRIYSSNAKMAIRFEEELTKLGYGPIDKKDFRAKWSRKCEFKIPGIEYKGLFYMPLPYCDNLEDSIRVTFDEKMKEFTVSCGGKGSNVQFQSQTGLLNHKELQTKKCAHCQVVYPGNQKMIDCPVDGRSFCQHDCAIAGGYVRAFRNDGNFVYQLKDTCIKDSISGEYYTNEESAKALGALPRIYDIFEVIEDDEITRNGIVIINGDELFRFHDGDNKKINAWLADGYVKQVPPPKGLPNCPSKAFEIVKNDGMTAIKFKTQRVVELYDDDKFIVEA